MVSTVKIASYLEGIEFPATKEQVIAYADGRDAPADIMKALQNMRGGKFYTMAGIWDATGAAA